MASRTQIEFKAENDVWPVVTSWASKHGYRPKRSTSSGRVYQKGIGFLVAPMMLSVEQSEGTTMIEAWIRMNLFTRAMALFILPAEMKIESGGFRAVVPRTMARNAVNKLLADLGQPLIP